MRFREGVGNSGGSLLIKALEKSGPMLGGAGPKYTTTSLPILTLEMLVTVGYLARRSFTMYSGNDGVLVFVSFTAAVRKRFCHPVGWANEGGLGIDILLAELEIENMPKRLRRSDGLHQHVVVALCPTSFR